jgi:serine protease
MTPPVAEVIALIEKATIALPLGAKLRPARFVLYFTGNGGAPRAQIEGELALLGASAVRLHPSDPTTLLLTLSNRAIAGQRADAFSAGYALADHYGAVSCEPEIETDFFPEPEPKPRLPGEPESFDNFPPGCWVDSAAALEGKYLWALERMHVPDAWALSQARGREAMGMGIVIAQPDTGVALHAELDDVLRAPSHNYIESGSDPTDPLNYDGTVGHGTGTASVAVSRESGHVLGTAPRAIHMPIRAIDNVVRVSQVNVTEAVDFAADHGAHVITMSLGGIPSIALEKAIRRAVDAGLIVLAAAGNCVGLVVWPARYDICIAVAGTNASDLAWKGSCRGADVDISAPGENVYRAKVYKGQTAKGIEVGQGQGTSFAVAMTAGVAALWLAHHGRANLLAAARARDETLQSMFLRLLRATARRPIGWDSGNMGAGVVDARALLAADLDLGRDRETTLELPGADSGPLSVRRLVSEAVSPDAALSAIDWTRYGAEIATNLLELKKQVDDPGDARLKLESVLDAPPALSSALRAASGGTALGDALGVRAA